MARQQSEKRTAVYAGSFDPITLGHLDVVRRSANLFDRVIVGVALRHGKRPLFSLRERVALVRTVTDDIPNVEVKGFSGLIIDFVQQNRASAVVRGLRAVMDFDYEFQMALTNRDLSAEIETVFFMTAGRYSFLSSSMVKEVKRLGGDVSSFVPKSVEEALRRRFASA
jgi:pantetheine-phosphate adenylyltransferase